MPPEPSRFRISQRPIIAPGPKFADENAAAPPIGAAIGDGVPTACALLDIWGCAVPNPEGATAWPCGCVPTAMPCDVDAGAATRFLPATTPTIKRISPSPAAPPPPATSGVCGPPVTGGVATEFFAPGTDGSGIAWDCAPAAGAAPRWWVLL